MLAGTRENLEGFANIGTGGAFTEVRGGAHGGQFLGESDIDELIQGDAFGFGELARLVEERFLEAERKPDHFKVLVGY